VERQDESILSPGCRKRARSRPIYLDVVWSETAAASGSSQFPMGRAYHTYLGRDVTRARTGSHARASVGAFVNP